MGSEKSWLEISAGRLRRNYATLTRAAAADGRSTSVLAVVKANAYGHGAEICSRVLADVGARWFGVTDSKEGRRVRRALAGGAQGIEPEILVMCGPLPEDAGSMVAERLTPVVWTPEQVAWLAGAANSADPLPVHLEIDTGMSRQGVPAGPALERLLDRVLSTGSLTLEGAFTHFASAEIAGSPLTALQQERFELALRQIDGRGVRLRWIHAGNSSTIDEALCLAWIDRLARHFGAQPLVRSGLALYGHTLPLESGAGSLELLPILSWKTRVLALTDVPAGATVGYNATFTARRPMRLALLPVGYADGLRRELSGTDREPGGWAVIGGRRAPIVGRVSMNLTTIDVSDLPDVAVGDEVTLLGNDITAVDHARLAHTIPYEILCGLRGSPRLEA